MQLKEHVVQDGKFLLESRFGRISINLENALFFPKGLVGMNERLNFCLAEFPGKESPFRILQSLEEITLAFVVLPLGAVNPFIELGDVKEIADIIQVHTDDIALLLIASTHTTPTGKEISVNLRAPVIINLKEKAAAQYVFPHAKYNIRHVLKHG